MHFGSSTLSSVWKIGRTLSGCRFTSRILFCFISNLGSRSHIFIYKLPRYQDAESLECLSFGATCGGSSCLCPCKCLGARVSLGLTTRLPLGNAFYLFLSRSLFHRVCCRRRLRQLPWSKSGSRKVERP